MSDKQETKYSVAWAKNLPSGTQVIIEGTQKTVVSSRAAGFFGDYVVYFTDGTHHICRDVVVVEK